VYAIDSYQHTQWAGRNQACVWASIRTVERSCRRWPDVYLGGPSTVSWWTSKRPGSGRTVATTLSGVAVYLWRVGLELADKPGSGIGAVCGLLSLPLGLVQLMRDGWTAVATPSTVNTVGKNSGQALQADTVVGDIDMRRRG
jgi:hypothetical protein